MNLNPFKLMCAAGLFAIFSSTLLKSPVLPLFAVHLGATASEVGLIDRQVTACFNPRDYMAAGRAGLGERK
jgi:hypothetical protein